MTKGARCPACQGKTLYTIETVKNLFLEKGYILITQNYENMHQKLETMCPNGHSYITTLDVYTKHRLGCLKCRGVQRYSVEEVRDILKKENYILLSNRYENRTQQLEIICPKNHRTFTTMSSFINQESRCKFCVPYPQHTLESVKFFVEKEGYTLISTSYKDAHSKITVLCPNQHHYTVSFSNFKNCNSRCTECSIHGSSKPEREITKWIKQFYPDADKRVLFYDPTNGKKRLELDVYIEKIGLAIEYNGLIWHCDKYKENDFHINKMKLASSLGIRVINIFGDEWRDRKDQIKNYLLSVMNKNPINVGARKTDLRVVDKKEAKQFLEENHIQGDARLDIAFGLYYNNDLVGVMTGDQHHRQGQENIFVLNRLAFKSGISVQGGSSKLLKALISYAKEQGYSKLISWSDNRWSEGRVYEKMGFILEEEMKPDYSYTKQENRVSKQSCQKKNLIQKGAVGGMGITEKELALTLGLHRIYDCGKKRWVMDLKL
jgi:GNAT superfamily N-acetyltransferase